MTPTTVSVRRRIERAVSTPMLALCATFESPAKVGWYGKVDTADGTHLEVSKLDGEAIWTVDALWVGNLPRWANGYGARYLMTHPVNPTIAAQLDAALQGE